MIFAEPYESFANVARRLNLASRAGCGADWVLDGAYDEAVGLMLDLEREILIAIEQNEALADEEAA